MRHEYRCTFPDQYPHGSLGYANPSARQGYYVWADNAAEAGQHLAKQFPNERIEIQYWKSAIGIAFAHAQGKSLLILA